MLGRAAARASKRALLPACLIAAGCATSPVPQTEAVADQDVRRETLTMALGVAEGPDTRELPSANEKILHVDLLAAQDGDAFAYVYFDATETGWNAAHRDFASCWGQAGGAVDRYASVEALRAGVNVNGLKSCLHERDYNGAFYASTAIGENGSFDAAPPRTSLVSLGLRGVSASATPATATMTDATPQEPVAAPAQPPYLQYADAGEDRSARPRGAAVGRRPGEAMSEDGAGGVSAADAAALDALLAALEAPIASPAANHEANLDAAEQTAAAKVANTPETAGSYERVISDTPIEKTELAAATPVSTTAAVAGAAASARAGASHDSPLPAVDVAAAPAAGAPAESEQVVLAAGPVAPPPAPSAETTPADAVAFEPEGMDTTEPDVIEIVEETEDADPAPIAEQRTSAPTMFSWARLPGRGRSATEESPQTPVAASDDMQFAESVETPNAPPAPPPVAPSPTPAAAESKRAPAASNLPTLEALLAARAPHAARADVGGRGVVYQTLED